MKCSIPTAFHENNQIETYKIEFSNVDELNIQTALYIKIQQPSFQDAMR